MPTNFKKINIKKSKLKKIYSQSMSKDETIWDQLASLYKPTNEGLANITKESGDFVEYLLKFFFDSPQEKCAYCGVSNPAHYANCKNCSALIRGGNLDKIKFSNNFWDYLDDLEYMPSFHDRVNTENRTKHEKYGNRVKIWDYFFRINSDDLGQPQRYCINLLKEFIINLTAISEEIKQQSGETKQYYIKRRDENLSKLKNLLFRLQPNVAHLDEIKINKDSLDNVARQAEKVIQELEKSIIHLQTEANKIVRPSDAEVRDWLDNDLRQIKQKSLEKMHLTNNELTATEFRLSGETNPFTFSGPAQLQDLEKISKPYQPYPKGLSDENISLLQVLPIPDKAKHLLARQIINTQNSSEIMFAVHHIEHIAVGDTRLAQSSYFYDFVSGQVIGESIAEYYYQDIVSIQLNHEYRRVPMDYSKKKFVEVEDAPVFRMNFTDGHSHSVTFLNEAVKQQLYMFLGGEKSQSEASNFRNLEKVSEREENQFTETASFLRQKLRLFKKFTDVN